MDGASWGVAVLYGADCVDDCDFDLCGVFGILVCFNQEHRHYMGAHYGSNTYVQLS